ncbi:MAG: ABC transporter substrate-binding protein [Candidatus Cellulosilyticum pullistercoris]|uniref:ABC transporter substrate-binding protein n=1 Tax=Candidatus Cellulosilyticum pullistercoris TaxID=2838521 RepID=A0A9E2KER8_9FIRM|nr:ABC transporter substrate-binding protein [Candidatus Cellulosilyticum pullistercoris]
MKKTVKRLLSVLMLGTISLSFVGCSSGGENGKVVVYNWGDYIDPAVNDMFTKETGIKVVYSDYANNEEMYASVEPGNVKYDVIFPSDYMIEKMINKNMLQKIDFSKIPNYENIDEQFLNLPYDPNNEYSVPYMWGTVGIVYNKTMVDETVDSWDILWDSKYKGQIFMYDSERDSIMVALKKLGYSMNTRDEKELEEAKQLLIEQAPLVLAYVGDEGKNKMVNGEAALMIAWAGDAVVMLQENPDLAYVVPKEGSNYFVDGIVIPENAENVEQAYEYINFLCRPDIAAMNAEYIGYSTPISAARELLPDEMKNSEVAYPDESILNGELMEMFNDPSDVASVYSSIWTQVKASNS